MKRIIFTAFFITLAALGAFCQNGVIRELTGEVELKRSGASAFVPASAGDAVSSNTIVSTGFRSTAIIAIGSSLITVRPLTRLTLAEIQSAETTENINVNLQSGRVRVEVKPAAGTKTNFTVQSPSATASVRGTSFEFDTHNLSVIEGRVSFQGLRGSSRPISAGFRSNVDRDGNTLDQSDANRSNFQPPPPTGTDSTSGKSAPLPTGIKSSPKAPSTGDLGVDVIYED